MEEIIEQLRELNEQVSFSLELPSEDDLVEIEESILISLPYELRLYLLEASDVICGTIEPVTAADERSHTYLPEVAAHAWDLGLPREYIPIAEYNGGYGCIDQEGKVYFWTQAGMAQEHWESFAIWCRDVWMGDKYTGE